MIAAPAIALRARALAWVVACSALGGCPHPASIAHRPEAAAPSSLVGAWRVGTGSWEEVAVGSDGARFGADGVFERGRIAPDGRFTAEPNPGPSGPEFVARYEVDATAGVVTFLLDGAEERAPFTIIDAERWQTRYDGPDEVVVVRYVRAR